MKLKGLYFWIALILLAICVTLMFGVRYQSGAKTVVVRLSFNFSNWRIGGSETHYNLPPGATVQPSDKSYYFLPATIRIKTEEPISPVQKKSN